MGVDGQCLIETYKLCRPIFKIPECIPTYQAFTLGLNLGVFAFHVGNNAMISQVLGSLFLKLVKQKSNMHTDNLKELTEVDKAHKHLKKPWIARDCH